MQNILMINGAVSKHINGKFRERKKCGWSKCTNSMINKRSLQFNLLSVVCRYFFMFMFDVVICMEYVFLLWFYLTILMFCKTNKFSDRHYTSFFLSSGTCAECGKLQEQECKRVYERTKQAPYNSSAKKRERRYLRGKKR